MGSEVHGCVGRVLVPVQPVWLQLLLQLLVLEVQSGGVVCGVVMWCCGVYCSLMCGMVCWLCCIWCSEMF